MDPKDTPPIDPGADLPGGVNLGDIQVQILIAETTLETTARFRYSHQRTEASIWVEIPPDVSIGPQGKEVEIRTDRLIPFKAHIRGTLGEQSAGGLRFFTLLTPRPGPYHHVTPSGKSIHAQANENLREVVRNS